MGDRTIFIARCDNCILKLRKKCLYVLIIIYIVLCHFVAFVDKIAKTFNFVHVCVCVFFLIIRCYWKDSFSITKFRV